MIRIAMYPLNKGDSTVEMPYGSQILSVGEQNRTLCMWALVDTNSTRITRKFRVYSTGSEIDRIELQHLKFIETVTDDTELFEWHVFEYEVK